MSPSKGLQALRIRQSQIQQHHVNGLCIGNIDCGTEPINRVDLEYCAGGPAQRSAHE